MKFADPIDEAADREQQYLSIALESRPSPKPFTGFCSYCKDTIEKATTAMITAVAVMRSINALKFLTVTNPHP